MMAKMRTQLCFLLICFVEYTYASCTTEYTLGANDTLLSDVTKNNEVGDQNGEVILTGSYWTIDPIVCQCGVITEWQFYAKKKGTVHFYVIDNVTNIVVGSTSVTVGDQGIGNLDNYFRVPLSSPMWIPVVGSYILGFYSAGNVITYIEETSDSVLLPSYRNKNVSPEKAIGDAVNYIGYDFNTTRRWAISAKLEPAHKPMFLNLPFSTSLYTHQGGTQIHIISVIDVDPPGYTTSQWSIQEVIQIKPQFTFDNSNGITAIVKYNTSAGELPPGTHILTYMVTDGCKAQTDLTSTGTITITLFNDPPSFDGLPHSIEVLETDSTPVTGLHTFNVKDTSDLDTITCNKVGVSPTELSLVKIGIRQWRIESVAPSTYHTATNYLEITIMCDDKYNFITSNFQVVLRKFTAPFFTNMPATVIGLDRNGVVSTSIFKISYNDTDSGDVVTVQSLTPAGAFSINSIGTVSFVASLPLSQVAYDLQISINDSVNNMAQRILSVITTGYNAPPAFVNLPATKYVMENTEPGTFIYQLMYTDKNVHDSFVLSFTGDTNFNNSFNFNATTGQITVAKNFSYEDYATLATLTFSALFTINDGTGIDVSSSTASFTVILENVNEPIHLDIGNCNVLVINEAPAGTSFPALCLSKVDEDDYSSHIEPAYYTMDCGDDSKYFKLDTSVTPPKTITLAQDYDMDIGLPGTHTCTITVRDVGGFTDTGTVTLNITNINDNSPKFPHRNYVFIAEPTDPFFTYIADMSATDADSDIYGSTNGILTYSFHPATVETYFQINMDGILYVRDVSSFNYNDMYIFNIIATDYGNFAGTCTVTVIFNGETSTTTTTTTERNLVFTDEHLNYFWLLLLGLLGLALIVIIVLMIWWDPVVHEYMEFKLLKLSDMCRKKPKPKEPKRTVGKLTVMINNKTLENDPDNAMPWELLAKDGDVPEINEVQEIIEKRKEKQDKDYKNFSGLPLFEKGKGTRKLSDDNLSDGKSSPEGNGRPDSDSPKYATFVPRMKRANDDQELQEDNGGEEQWGDWDEQQRSITPVAPYSPEAQTIEDATITGKRGNRNTRTQSHSSSISERMDF